LAGGGTVNKVPKPLLEVIDVSKHFGGVYALNGASLSIETGEVHALIGPNGAGKTTLIHVLSGALRPDQGTLFFDQTDLLRQPMHKRVALGLARSYQITNVFSRLSVLDNVTLAVQSRVRDWGSSFSFWKPFALDSAIVDEAHALLAQEPMAGMGPDESARMLDLIERLAQQVTLLLVEHDMAAVFRLADRISVLVGGRVIASGEPEHIRSNVDVRRAYLGDEVL
jgi:branched-chain amino acid transport system ATP-binding protein